MLLDKKFNHIKKFGHLVANLDIKVIFFFSLLDSSTLGGFRPESPFSLKSYNAGNESTVDFGDLTHHSRSSFIKPARFVYNERNR